MPPSSTRQYLQAFPVTVDGYRERFPADACAIVKPGIRGSAGGVDLHLGVWDPPARPGRDRRAGPGLPTTAPSSSGAASEERRDSRGPPERGKNGEDSRTPSDRSAARGLR